MIDITPTNSHAKWEDYMKAWNCTTIDFHQEMGKEYSKIVQIIVKGDRGKAIGWRSVSCEMICYHIPDENTLFDSQSAFCTHSAICSLHFVPSLHFVSDLQSAVCILYYQVSVAPIQFIFGYSYSHNTPNLLQNTSVWVNSTFSFFSSLKLTSLTMFQVIHPTPKK